MKLTTALMDLADFFRRSIGQRSMLRASSGRVCHAVTSMPMASSVGLLDLSRGVEELRALPATVAPSGLLAAATSRFACGDRPYAYGP